MKQFLPARPRATCLFLVGNTTYEHKNQGRRAVSRHHIGWRGMATERSLTADHLPTSSSPASPVGHLGFLMASLGKTCGSLVETLVQFICRGLTDESVEDEQKRERSKTMLWDGLAPILFVHLFTIIGPLSRQGRNSKEEASQHKNEMAAGIYNSLSSFGCQRTPNTAISQIGGPY